jgi:hypothetical protein
MMAKKSVFLGLGSLLLVACSSKPPSCADSETVDQIKANIVDALMSKYSKNIAKDDPDGLLKKFMSELKVDLTKVVSDGYDEGAKKYSCSGNLKISMVGGATAERAIDYTTQKVEGDSDKKFLLNVDNFTPFVFIAMKNSEEYYDSNRWVGEWNGAIQCEGINGATGGALGPFSVPATMKVEGQKATMDFSVGDYKEKLEGSISTVGGIIRVPGNTGLYPSRESGGNNLARIHFDTGFFDGEKYDAKGDVAHLGVVQRKCKINLAKGGSVPTLAKITENPIMYVEEKKKVADSYQYMEKVTLLGDPEYLPEGTGIGFATNKGHISLYVYGDYKGGDKLKKGQCVSFYSNAPITFDDSPKVNIEKIVDSCSD